MTWKWSNVGVSGCLVEGRGRLHSLLAPSDRWILTDRSEGAIAVAGYRAAKRRGLSKWVAAGMAALAGLTGGLGIARAIHPEPAAQQPPQKAANMQHVNRESYLSKTVASLFQIASMVSGAVIMKVLDVALDETIKAVVMKLIKRLKEEFFDDDDIPNTDHELLNNLLRANGAFVVVPVAQEIEDLRADIRDAIYERASRDPEFEADLRMLLAELRAAERRRVLQTNVVPTYVSRLVPADSPFDRSAFSTDLLALDFDPASPTISVSLPRGRVPSVTIDSDGWMASDVIQRRWPEQVEDVSRAGDRSWVQSRGRLLRLDEDGTDHDTTKEGQ